MRFKLKSFLFILFTVLSLLGLFFDPVQIKDNIFMPEILYIVLSVICFFHVFAFSVNGDVMSNGKFMRAFIEVLFAQLFILFGLSFFDLIAWYVISVLSVGVVVSDFFYIARIVPSKQGQN